MSSLGGTSSTYWFCTIDSTSVKSRSCSYVAPLSVPLLATEPPSERVSTTSKEPITNAFFMESPRSRVASAPLSEPLFRVLRLALVTHLEIEARPLQRARVPHCPDALSLLHVVAFLHDDIGNVRVQRVVLVVVVQDDQVSVPLEPARVHDVPGEHGRHVAALPGLDVHAVAERPSSEPGMHLSAERADHTALRRPRQPAPESTETHGRGVSVPGFGGGILAMRRCLAWRSRMNASSRRAASVSSPTIRSWYARSSRTFASRMRRLAASRSTSLCSRLASVRSVANSLCRVSSRPRRSSRRPEVPRYS